MIAWLRMKLNSAISCVVGAHRACDGWCYSREEPGMPLICHCDCHTAELTQIGGDAA